jgi:hypothetical protein
MGNFGAEKSIVAILVVAMAITVTYGVLKLRQMQGVYDAHCPVQEKEKKEKKEKKHKDEEA